MRNDNHVGTSTAACALAGLSLLLGGACAWAAPASLGIPLGLITRTSPDHTVPYAVAGSVCLDCTGTYEHEPCGAGHNDKCLDAEPLSCGAVICGTTNSDDDFFYCYFNADRDWYHFTLAEPRSVTLKLKGTADLRLSLAEQYDGRFDGLPDPCDSTTGMLLPVLDAPACSAAEVTLCLPAGDHFVVVEPTGYAACGTEYRLERVCGASCTPQPPGDTCANARPVWLDSPAYHAEFTRTTCGYQDDYNTTCIPAGSDREDAVWKLYLAYPEALEIWVNPHGVGPVTVTLADNCPPVSGTCRRVTGGPTPVRLTTDVLQSGTYHLYVDAPANATCIPSFDLFIISPTTAGGACCIQSVCYAGVGESLCAPLGGVWQGPGSVCDPLTFTCSTGACCNNYTCSTTNYSACVSGGGTWLGPDVPCLPDICGYPPGACCYVDGTCAELTELACSGSLGTWQGALSGCEARGCPFVAPDCNGNHIADNVDISTHHSQDCDGNGVPDECDLAHGAPDQNHNGVSDACDPDSDGDGTIDDLDGCPFNSGKTQPGVCGCGSADIDTDGDGVLNCQDGCPNDPAKISPGACGCGVADTDSDGDGTPDCHDGCPSNPAKTQPGACGCAAPDSDGDGDGVLDCADGCPSDPTKIEPGACGCGVADADTDGDGVPDCVDNCPTAFNSDQTDADGDGIGDACDDSERPGPPPAPPLLRAIIDVIARAPLNDRFAPPLDRFESTFDGRVGNDLGDDQSSQTDPNVTPAAEVERLAVGAGLCPAAGTLSLLLVLAGLHRTRRR